MSWSAPINTYADKLTAAWNKGDMPAFRRLAGQLDAVFSDAALDAHGEELFYALGSAAAAGMDASLKALAQIDLGFGPSHTDALPFVAARKDIAALLDSAAWRDVPYALRDRAFFSARVADLQTLTEMRTRIEAALDWTPGGEEGGPVMDGGRFEKEMRRILINGGVRTASQEELGTVRDIMSTPRLQLIFKTQTEMARGWSALKTGMDPDILSAVPAYEFVRVLTRKNPRPSSFWQSRWRQAVAIARGVGCLESAMVGLKTSPVWQALGNLGPFGNPFDPFDYGTGMGREDRDRDYCEAVGLLKAGEPVRPVRVPDLNERLDAGVDGLDESALARLKSAFGTQIRIEAGRAIWK